MRNFLIPFTVFTAAFSSCFAANLYCTFIGNPQQCSFYNISNVASANEAITVVGQPSTYVDTLTTWISFGPYSIFDYFPTNVFTIFPNLNSIGMNNNSLTNLVTNAFSNCGKLTNIYGSYLSFTNVPAQVGSTCVNVTTFNFNWGLISTIDVNAFKGMKLLHDVSFSNNKITCIPPGLFANNPVIQYVDFSYNQITALDVNTFTGLLNLNNIGLSSNQISFLPAMNFSRTGWTSSWFNFMLDSNPINAIHPELLSNVFLSRTAMMGQNQLSFNQMTQNSPTTCLPQQYTSIASYNWVAANASLDVCYASWTPTIENYQVSCAPPKTTTTTTSTVSAIITTLAGNPSATTPSGSSSSNTGCQCGASGSGGQCPCQQSAFQLIFNRFKNLTMNLGFN